MICRVIKPWYFKKSCHYCSEALENTIAAATMYLLYWNQTLLQIGVKKRNVYAPASPNIVQAI